VLQAIFEFQTLVCELTGMDASNASMYDGATAAAEAATMTRARGRQIAVVSAAVNPEVLSTIRTYCFSRLGTELILAPEKDGVTDPRGAQGTLNDATACVYVPAAQLFRAHSKAM
jgi:glycine dehydrogenase subunit 1